MATPEHQAAERPCRQCGALFRPRGYRVVCCSRSCGASLGNARRLFPTIEEKFWQRTERRSPDECWLWTGRKDGDGYGLLEGGGKGRKPRLSAHRVSWALANKREPDGVVCHSCDNPPCVNPSHLWLGDQAANMRDMAAKGRGRGPLAKEAA